MSTGPLTLASGSEQTIQFGIVWSQGSRLSRTQSPSCARDVAEVRATVRVGFCQPPAVRAAAGHADSRDAGRRSDVVSEGQIQLLASVSGPGSQVESPDRRLANLPIQPESYPQRCDGTISPRARIAHVPAMLPERCAVRGLILSHSKSSPTSLNPYVRGGFTASRYRPMPPEIVDPVQPGAARFAGFPTPEIAGSGNGGPTEAQQVGPARWLIHTAGTYGSYDVLSRSHAEGRTVFQSALLGHYARTASPRRGR